MLTNATGKYFFFGLLLTTIVFTFFIFRPFWMVLVLGASFAIVLYPIYKLFNKLHSPNWLSSLLTVLIFAILICGPLFGVGLIIFKQSQNVYHLVTDGNNINPFIEKINTSINNLIPNETSFDLKSKVSNFVSILSNNITDIFSTTISTIFSLILLFLTIFYLLKDSETWRKTLLEFSPLSRENNEKILNRISLTINGVIKGSILTTFIQGIALGIGLAIFNVPNPALWAVVGAIASFIPIFGTALVTVPAVIFIFLSGNIAGAIGLTIWAILAVGLIDNFLSPLIFSNKIRMPAFLILFAVLGGLALLGPVGILIGPLMVSLLYTLILIYKDDFEKK